MEKEESSKVEMLKQIWTSGEKRRTKEQHHENRAKLTKCSNKKCSR